MYIKFLQSNEICEASVSVDGNIVTLIFANEVVLNTKGFHCYSDEKCEYDIGGTFYEKFNTIYRNDEETAAYNGYQLSNDGSVYVPANPIITFETGVGGVLEGIVIQQVSHYEYLDVPTPIAKENWEFLCWSPTIPETGKIEESTSFSALFKNIIIPPEDNLPISPTLEERVVALEEDMKKINEALGGV